MPNRPAFLRSMRPSLGLEPRRTGRAPARPCRRFRRAAWRTRLARARHRNASRHSVAAKRAVAVHGAQVEKDIDRQQILRLRAADPVGDALAPGCERAAPLRVLRHHAALAIRHADLVQDVGDMAAELLEPAVLRAARLALGEDQRVVLIHGEQAFAAAGRAEHRDRIGAGRIRHVRPHACALRQ